MRRLGSTKPNIHWASLTTSILPVWNNFMKNLSTTKSNALRSDLPKGHTSIPQINIGRHLLLINCNKTSSREEEEEEGVWHMCDQGGWPAVHRRRAWLMGLWTHGGKKQINILYAAGLGASRLPSPAATTTDPPETIMVHIYGAKERFWEQLSPHIIHRGTTIYPLLAHLTAGHNRSLYLGLTAPLFCSSGNSCKIIVWKRQ